MFAIVAKIGVAPSNNTKSFPLNFAVAKPQFPLLGLCYNLPAIISCKFAI